MASVTILLALYNGAEALGPQLRSFADQTHADWSLLVSDDGSTDDGPQIIRDFATEHPDHDIDLIAGPGQGFVANFLSLLRAAGPHVAHVALSDQDDIWLPEKLDTAVAALGRLQPGVPGLYCGRTFVCRADMSIRGLSPEFRRPPSFRNAMVQNIAGGNTMVLNRAALDLVQASAHLAGNAVTHDWWLYQIITGAGGAVIYDTNPLVKYRQHGANQIGANDTFAASWQRLRQMLAGDFKGWNDRNLAILDACRDQLTPKNRQLLDQFAAGRRAGLLRRLSTLPRCGIYRQTRLGHVALWVAAALGRM